MIRKLGDSGIRKLWDWMMGDGGTMGFWEFQGRGTLL